MTNKISKLSTIASLSICCLGGLCDGPSGEETIAQRKPSVKKQEIIPQRKKTTIAHQCQTCPHHHSGGGTNEESKHSVSSPQVIGPVFDNVKWGHVEVNWSGKKIIYTTLKNYKKPQGSQLIRVKRADMVLETGKAPRLWKWNRYQKQGDRPSKHQHKQHLDFGIQPHELEWFSKKVKKLVLSTGMNDQLGVNKATLEAAKKRGIKVYVLNSKEAWKRFDELEQEEANKPKGEQESVGILLHSTC